jgi:transcriptional regulator with XRE-family HTH domain
MSEHGLDISFMEKAMTTASAIHNSKDPGRVLRSLRAERGWTLAELSSRTGLPVSTLSKVENNKMALTYDKMVRIATGLNIDIGVLFASPQSDIEATPMPLSGRRSVTRSDEGRVIETQVARQIYPAADLLDKQLVPLLMEVRARSLEEWGPLLRHPGEEFVLVLEGTLELHTEFYAAVQLRQGDSIYFDSAMAHGYVAASEDRCRILSVNATADWGKRQVDARLGPQANTILPFTRGN